MENIKVLMINEVNNSIIDYASENKMNYNDAWFAIYNEYKAACYNSQGVIIAPFSYYIMGCGALTPSWIIWDAELEEYVKNYCPLMVDFEYEDIIEILCNLIWEAFIYLNPNL